MNNGIELLVRFVITAFAVWRISSIFAREKGPFDMFVYIRKQIYMGTVYNSLIGKIFVALNNGIACVWCNSVWFASVFSIPLSGSIFEWIIYTFALSGVAIIIEVLYGFCSKTNTSIPG
jgi:hypothetical protein